ncbi:hypothetical protein TTHERM_00079880 (macronuclear) [Tetrahymena thermophila SB210]|uniref:Uncharacterized protein n=1 Tax=Tetrahymena thermophila (strain SB210) TaxID=312017 RepID=Q23FM7_TETTS|nr:hypothetical protein TTHERM_00079880 [Tetrahymena thermophila SB210]EAR95583.2 hypothetical protein TTHERM_00079880 [Tetrahymena thermophila SB210]|eukprot:XP_001015828.2 hypothetical protein TTHERM_00079880 [Tetrahymena thermophila SB210]
MKQKLGRPPLIQIEFNEGIKQSNLDNNQQQNQFSTIVNQQGLKEGNQVNSPTPNFTSPSNKQHQQQMPQGSYYFSQFHQHLAPQSNPNQQEIYYNDKNAQSMQFSNQIQPFSQYSSGQQQIYQNQNQNESNKQELVFKKNMQNEINDSSVYQSSQSPYQSEIQNQYNDYLIEQKYQQYVSGQSNDSILKKNQSNGFDTQSSQQTNSNRDISPQIKGNQSKYKGSEVTDNRIKSIANVNKSLVRNSSSSNIVIQPQRIQVDMSEFMLKKPPQPPSNRTPSGREQNSQNNINNNMNEGLSLLNLTPKSQYLKISSSSKSPSHKKTKSLMDFIKNGISNSTKNLNRPLKENKSAMNQKEKLNQSNQNNSQKNISEGRNYSSNSRKQNLKNAQENTTSQNLKVSNFYSQTNRSGASTTNQTVSPLTSPNTLNQQKQNNQSSHNIQASQEKKNNKKITNQRTQSTSNLHQNNQQIKFSPPSKKDTITQNGEINQNGILFKNSTKAISIKQKVLSDSKKQKSSKSSRFATEADNADLNDYDDENLSEQVEINKVLKSNEQSPKKNLDLQNKTNQQNDIPENSLIYRQMMITQSQIGKEHPTPSQIKYLQSNQKKKYFEQQSENVADEEKKDIENAQKILNQVQKDNLVISQQSSNKKSSNAYGTDSLWQDNIEDSFQNYQNYHSIQKIPVSLGFNGFKQVRESQSLKSGLTQQINSQNTLNSTKNNNSNYQTNFANNANNQTLHSTIENEYSTIQKVQGNFFSNSTNANQTANPILQLNAQTVEPQLPQILLEQQENIKRSKKNESLQTSSEKHLRENYPFFLENSDSKEQGRDQNDNLQNQFEGMINSNEQKSSNVSLIPITNINPQYTENYLIQGNSNRILQQLQNMGAGKQNYFRKEQSGINEQNQQNLNQKKDSQLDYDQSVMVFQSSQDTLKKEKLEQQDQGSTGLKKLNNQKSNNEISELSFEAKNIDNSLKNLSSIETNTINSLQMQNNCFNLISSTPNNNLSSSYMYNQGGLQTPKQSQNKFSVMKIIDNTSIPISKQIIKQDAVVISKTSSSINASPQSNQRSNKHQISPTSNAKLNKIIEQRSLSQEKGLTSKSLGNFAPQQFINKQIYVQDNSQFNQNLINQSIVSTPYQNYSNNNLSSMNTLERHKVINQNLNNQNQNICYESYQLPNYQQTSVGTDRQALNLMTTPKQYNNSQALHFLTSDCSSYRVDPLYQQQINQYALQKSSEFKQIPETTTDLQRMQTDQSLFESYQYLPQSLNQLHSTKNQDVRSSFPYLSIQSQNKNTNQTQQIGNHNYQHQFFHPIDIQLEQKENNQSFQNYNNSSEFLRQQQIANYQKQQDNSGYYCGNQQDNYEKQVNEIDYGGKQLESQYLMQRLNQISKQQQQQLQSKQQQNLKSKQNLSKHSNNQTIDQSKIERSFITTTEELGAELQENKISTNRLKQHVQCLENRIRKLVNEDENLERKLQLITQRKEDMSQIKMKNKEDNLRLQNLKYRQQEQIKEMKRKISQGRIQSKERLEQSKMQLQMQKRHIANQVKEVNQSNKSLLDETRNQEALRNSFIISSIKNLERKLVEDKTNRATQALQQSKISQMNKIEQEQEQQEELKMKIQQLEQIEQQLIDNLEQKYEQNKSFLYV